MIFDCHPVTGLIQSPVIAASADHNPLRQKPVIKIPDTIRAEEQVICLSIPDGHSQNLHLFFEICPFLSHKSNGIPTFYVDNIFVYQPLPAVKSIYYMDVDLYRYFIGRADQSVNEKVMVTRVDQQVRVTKLMIDSHNLKQLYQTQRKLARYMTSYLSMMMTISSIFLIIDGSPAALGKKTELWEYLRTSNPELYHKLKYRSLSFVGNIPGYQGRKLSVKLYRLARKIYKFN